MKKYKRNFVITIDKAVKGFGYTRLKETTQTIHTIYLFMFIIAWRLPIKTGKIQIAKWISGKTVQIGDKLFDFEYYSNINDLEVIYYRRSNGDWDKSTQYQFLNNGMYIVKDQRIGNFLILDDIDVSVFNPNKDIQGYIKSYKFIGVKELSNG